MALRSASHRAAAALALAILLALPGAAGAQADQYKQHMEKGVKLYADHNWSAARVEFRAAYDARPGANPLVNIALCYKEMFRYPQAIAALQEALAKHGDVMVPADKKAAEDAIQEMQSLLGTLTLAVTPRDATILVDGDELPPGAVDKPLLLGPDAHRIVVRADGYKTEERNVNLASGRTEAVSIALVPDKGALPDTSVVPPSLPPKADPPSPPRGIYLLGLGSLLFPTTHANGWPETRTDYGAGYGVRVGFQVNQVAGFDATYEHSSIDTLTDADATAYYRIVANRLAVGLRLMSPGRIVRFVGGFGGGFVDDSIIFNFDMSSASKVIAACKSKAGGGMAPVSVGCPFTSGSGIDAFALVEAGLEIDIDRVLLDYSAQPELQTERGLNTNPVSVGKPSFSVFGNHPLVNAGPAIRFGYRFW